MLKQITPAQQKQIDAGMRSMSVEQMIGQTLCPVAWNFGETPNAKTFGPILDNLKRKVEKYHLGSVFMAFGSSSMYKRVERVVRDATDIPVIINADLENGVGTRMADKVLFPWAMACGAANDPKLVETMGEATGVEGRGCGVHWTLGPLVDLCLNHGNPMTFGRGFGSNPQHVARMCWRRHRSSDGVRERVSTRSETGWSLCGHRNMQPSALADRGVPRPPQSRWLARILTVTPVSGMVSAAVGRGRPGPAEKRFLINHFNRKKRNSV